MTSTDNKRSLLSIFRSRTKLSYSSEINASDSEFRIRQLNDFATECIRKEKTDLEEADSLRLASLCPSKHGGLLDYPKIVTESAGRLSEKWDRCWDSLGDRDLHGEKTASNGVSHRSDTNKADKNNMDVDSMEDFYSSLSESASKLIVHHAWLTELLVRAGDIEKLAGVAGGLALVRNKIWHFNRLRETEGLVELYRETCELLECLGDQMSLYHCNTLTNLVMVDTESQDWEDYKPFHEGERCSYCVQMWWYYLETSRQFMWASLPPSMSHKILLSVLNSSLGVLTHRYSTLTPSPARLGQYRADLTAILLSVAEWLPSLSPDLPSLTRPDRDLGVLHSVHTKCELLVSMLVLVTSPPPTLLTRLESPRPHKRSGSSWLQLLSPGLYSPNCLDVSKTRVYSLTRLISDAPQPDWGLLVQSVVTGGLLLPRLILAHMGSFVPAVSETLARCGSLQCGGLCLGPASASWPLLVATGVLLPLIHSNKECHRPLVTCLAPLLSKLSPASWECLNASQVWNTRRPVWLGALVNLIDHFMAPAVEDLLRGVEEGRTWTRSHVAGAKQELVTNMLALLETLPLGLAGLLVYLEHVVPHTASPLAGSAVTQVLLSAVYQAISSLIPPLKQARLQKEKIDFLLALCESLCNDKDAVDLTILTKTVESALDLSQIAEIESLSKTRGRLPILESAREDPVQVAQEKFQVIAHSILQSDENKIFMMGLYR